jgi:peptide/nickel transport system ATP-binding protein
VTEMPLLTARSLSAGYRDGPGVRQVLADVDLELPVNKIVGLAGESGCGKSTLALLLAGYRSPGVRVLGGSVTFRDSELTALGPRKLRRWWGRHIAYLPQDTATALNPALRVGRQLGEVIELHCHLRRREALAAGTEMLQKVGIPDPAQAMRRYPHEFSGGQQQRIAIAIALAPGPEVVILDEPTTGLDVTVQARINELIVDLIRSERMTALYVSHNLALLADICDELRILYAGQVFESGPAAAVYFNPEHPYTRDLVAAVPHHLDDQPVQGIEGTPPPAVVLDRCAFGPRCRFHQSRCDGKVPLTERPGGRQVRCVRVQEVTTPKSTRAQQSPSEKLVEDEDNAQHLIEIDGLRVTYTSAAHTVIALEGLSLGLAPGEALGVVGESGSGKSTLLRAMAGLLVPKAGTMTFRGQTVPWDCGSRADVVRREVQIVFQNPDASLNPRHSLKAIIDHPLRRFRPDLDAQQRRGLISEVLEQLRLSTELLDRYPSEVSGGQRQRVALARALVAGPAVVLCDEITSALDVSVQASILELLAELRSASQLAMVFVTHDLGVLRAVADRALVLQNGQLREQGQVNQLLRSPADDYTATLVGSIPNPTPPLEQRRESTASTGDLAAVMTPDTTKGAL